MDGDPIADPIVEQEVGESWMIHGVALQTSAAAQLIQAMPEVEAHAVRDIIASGDPRTADEIVHAVALGETGQ